MKLGLRTRTATDPAEMLAFDTEWWSVKMAKAHSAAVTDWAVQNMVGCLFLLIGSEEQDEIQRAETRGARFMDIRVELARDTTPEVAISRSATEADIESLAALSRTAFRGLTRFYADPQLPDDRCDDLYENWLRTSPGWAEEILTVGDGAGPVGFVTIHVNADRTEASIGLIAVDERVRGRGVGVNLSKAAVDWAWQNNIPRITVVTQGCNVRAQRAFQHAGFVTSKTDVWLHSWL